MTHNTCVMGDEKTNSNVLKHYQSLLLVRLYWREIAEIYPCLRLSSFLSGKSAWKRLNLQEQEYLDHCPELKEKILNENPVYIILLLVFALEKGEQINQNKSLKLPKPLECIRNFIQPIIVMQSVLPLPHVLQSEPSDS